MKKGLNWDMKKSFSVLLIVIVCLGVFFLWNKKDQERHFAIDYKELQGEYIFGQNEDGSILFYGSNSPEAFLPEDNVVKDGKTYYNKHSGPSINGVDKIDGEKIDSFDIGDDVYLVDPSTLDESIATYIKVAEDIDISYKWISEDAVDAWQADETYLPAYLIKSYDNKLYGIGHNINNVFGEEYGDYITEPVLLSSNVDRVSQHLEDFVNTRTIYFLNGEEETISFVEDAEITDNNMSEPSSNTSLLKELLGSWNGLLQNGSNYTGIQLNFKSIDGDVVRGNLIILDNTSSTPNFDMGVESPFTATYNENRDSFLIRPNDESISYEFGLDGLFNYKLGLVHTHRE